MPIPAYTIIKCNVHARRIPLPSESASDSLPSPPILSPVLSSANNSGTSWSPASFPFLHTRYYFPNPVSRLPSGIGSHALSSKPSTLLPRFERHQWCISRHFRQYFQQHFSPRPFLLVLTKTFPLSHLVACGSLNNTSTAFVSSLFSPG